MPSPELLSTAEVAHILGRSVSTVSRLVSRGELTPVQRIGGGPGGSMFFDAAQIDDYLEREREAS